jgi:hypothetical protein
MVLNNNRNKDAKQARLLFTKTGFGKSKTNAAKAIKRKYVCERERKRERDVFTEGESKRDNMLIYILPLSLSLSPVHDANSIKLLQRYIKIKGGGGGETIASCHVR